MQKTVELLKRWEQTPAQPVKPGMIKTDAALQPRAMHLVMLKDRSRVLKASEEHVTRLCASLQGGRTAQLEPLLVADVDGILHLVDGHHRLKAYKRAKRQTVPVRVLPTTRADAVKVSRIVNAGGAKLPLTSSQVAEACWQAIAELTMRGRLDAGMTLRDIAALFGISKDTVGAMLGNVKQIKLCDFGPSTRDPETGWPTWKSVKEFNRGPLVEPTDAEQRLAVQAEKDAAQLAAVRDKLGPMRFTAAITRLLAEAKGTAEEEGWDGLRLWDALQEPVVY